MLAALLLSACSPQASPTIDEPTATQTALPQPIATSTIPSQSAPTLAPETSDIVPGGSVAIGITREPASLNPLDSSSTIDTVIRSFIVEGLVEIDGEGSYIPVLAAEMPAISSNGLVLTYLLQPGIRFSNGDRFSCADVQFTWKAILSEQAATNPSGYNNISSVQCANDLTVIVTFSQAYAPYLSLFPFILPRAAGSLDSISTWEFDHNPIGTGPWMVQSWEAGKSITLARNPYYREAGKPYLDSLVIQFLPNNVDGIARLINSKINIFWELTEADLLTLKESPNVTFAGAPYGSGENETILFNLADPTVDAPLDPAAHPHPILSDLRVRQAVALAIDRLQIANTLLDGKVSAGDSLLPAGPFACPPEPGEFSLSKANALLDEAGWQTGADGIRTKGALRLSLTIASTSGDSQRLKIERELVTMLQKVGIELVIENVPAETLFAGWDGGGLRPHGQFDLLLYTTGAGTDPASYLFNNFHSSRIPTVENGGIGSNYARYANPNVDAWIEEAARSVNLAQRNALYCQVAAQINQDLPRLFLFERLSLSGYRTDLQNFAVSPGPANFTFRSQNWWLSP